MLNFPVAGGTSGHFLGAALAAILLGPWLACLTLAVVLGVQAFVFADGGITALGANILNMGVIGALLVGGIMHFARRLAPKAILPITAIGAWLAVMLGATATSLELAISGTVPLGTVLPAMLGTHAADRRRRGDHHRRRGQRRPVHAPGPRPRPDRRRRMKRFTIIALALAIGLATAALAVRLQAAPDGLNRVAEDHGFSDAARRRTSRCPATPSPASQRGVAKGLAGFTGTLIVFAAGYGLVRKVARRRPSLGMSGTHLQSASPATCTARSTAWTRGRS